MQTSSICRKTRKLWCPSRTLVLGRSRQAFLVTCQQTSTGEMMGFRISDRPCSKNTRDMVEEDINLWLLHVHGLEYTYTHTCTCHIYAYTTHICISIHPYAHTKTTHTCIFHTVHIQKHTITHTCTQYTCRQTCTCHTCANIYACATYIHTTHIYSH